MMIDPYRFLSAFYEQQFFTLGYRCGWKRFETKLVKSACCRRKLSFSTIDQHEVRQRPRLTQKSGISPAHNLVHRLEIIGLTLNRAHLEFAIVGFLHRAVLADHHRRNILRALNVGYIE